MQDKKNRVMKKTSEIEKKKVKNKGCEVNHAASIQPGSAAAEEHGRGNGRTERERVW